jgi:Zn-dependent protease with chaperone function
MIDGRYFHPHSASFVPGRAELLDSKTLRVSGADGAVLAEAPLRKVKISSRLGNIARRLTFADGAMFETYDNDGVDDMLAEARKFSGDGWVDRLERSWRTVVVSVLLAGAVGAAFLIWGIPALALELALHTPADVAKLMSDQTMSAIDSTYLKPSKLPSAEQKKAQALFAHVASAAPRGEKGYRLLIRAGGPLKANAFALPDGRVVMTDELWALVKNDDEIEGVFAHEISHVDRAHGLQRVYEASLIPAVIAVVTGDLSQVSQLSVLLPAILVQSAYSRENEEEADGDAVETLKRMGAKPERFAELLKRLDAANCGKSKCEPGWLSDHPQTEARIEHLRIVEHKK